MNISDLNNEQLPKNYNLDAELFESLTPEERQVALKILQDLSSTGSSSLYDELWSEDYEEKPVDIDTFLCDDRYLGKTTENGKIIYPYWRDMYRKLFDPTRSFNECVPGDTLLPTYNGGFIRIDDLVNSVNSKNSKFDNYIYTYDTKTNKCVLSKVIKGVSKGIRQLYEVVMDNGASFRSTGDHKVFSYGKWIEVNKLSPGDYLTIYDNTDSCNSFLFDNKSYDKSLVSNHSIISITKLDTSEEVYDIEVDNLNHNFITQSGFIMHNCIFSGAIGIGKTTIAIYGICYILYKLMCLKNPQSFYRLASSDPIVIVFFNVSLDQSRGVAYSKLQNTLLASPWFLEHGEVVGLRSKEYVPGKKIEFRVGSTTNHSIGQNVYCLSGDTIVVTSEGDMSIADIAEKGSPVNVFGYDFNTNSIISSEKCMAVITKYVDTLVAITLEDGTIIKCTPDHLLMKSDGSYIKASEVTEGTDLMSL